MMSEPVHMREYVGTYVSVLSYSLSVYLPIMQVKSPVIEIELFHVSFVGRMFLQEERVCQGMQFRLSNNLCLCILRQTRMNELEEFWNVQLPECLAVVSVVQG